MPRMYATHADCVVSYLDSGSRITFPFDQSSSECPRTHGISKRQQFHASRCDVSFVEARRLFFHHRCRPSLDACYRNHHVFLLTMAKTPCLRVLFEKTQHCIGIRERTSVCSFKHDTRLFFRALQRDKALSPLETQFLGVNRAYRMRRMERSVECTCPRCSCILHCIAVLAAQ